MSAGEVVVHEIGFVNKFGTALRPIELGLLKPVNQIEAFNRSPSEIRVRIADGANDPRSPSRWTLLSILPITDLSYGMESSLCAFFRKGAQSSWY